MPALIKKTAAVRPTGTLGLNMSCYGPFMSKEQERKQPEAQFKIQLEQKRESQFRIFKIFKAFLKAF